MHRLHDRSQSSCHADCPFPGMSPSVVASHSGFGSISYIDLNSTRKALLSGRYALRALWLDDAFKYPHSMVDLRPQLAAM